MLTFVGSLVWPSRPCVIGPCSPLCPYSLPLSPYSPCFNHAASFGFSNTKPPSCLWPSPGLSRMVFHLILAWLPPSAVIIISLVGLPLTVSSQLALPHSLWPSALSVTWPYFLSFSGFIIIWNNLIHILSLSFLPCLLPLRWQCPEGTTFLYFILWIDLGPRTVSDT